MKDKTSQTQEITLGGASVKKGFIGQLHPLQSATILIILIYCFVAHARAADYLP